MLFHNVLKKRNISLYRLSKDSSIPYSTLRDLYTEKTSLSKASAEIIYKISKVLDISMEELLSSYMKSRPSFENFKSEVCHNLKRMGDLPFIIELLQSNQIREYFDDEWYLEALYLLALLDYLSANNDIPLCTDYDDIRKVKLSEALFPISITALVKATGNTLYYDETIKTCLPEFLKYNIIESNIRNVN